MIPSSVPMVHCPGRWDILARQLLTWGSRPGTPTPMGFLLPDVGPEPAGQALINLGLGGYAARALRSACRRGRTAEHVLGPHRSYWNVFPGPRLQRFGHGRNIDVYRILMMARSPGGSSG